MKELNSIKAEIQQQAHAAWLSAGGIGTIAAGTGFGKSRVAILECERISKDVFLPADELADILLVTPTEKLRDENWPQEFKDWNASWILNVRIKVICFASLKKEIGNKYKLVILDEIHHLTDMSATAFLSTGEDALTKFMAENLSESVMGLTATVPDPKRDPEKAAIIAQVAPVVFKYSLDQGVADGMIADYEIKVIMSNLDDVYKVIPAGTKENPFKVTEKAGYEFLEKNIKKFRMLAGKAANPSAKFKLDQAAMFATMKRNRFIYDLPSKTELARKCLKNICKEEKRTLVFCGSIEQSEALLSGLTYHSKSGSTAFNQFNAKEINTLGVVNAANEGLNLTDVDQALINQVDSNERNLTQRIGRCLRQREGHKAMIYILCVQGTADEKWLAKSLHGFDSTKITYYSSKNIV